MARVNEARPVDPPVKQTASTLPAAMPASRAVSRAVNDPRSFLARGVDELLAPGLVNVIIGHVL